MKSISSVALFCDDIRFEKSNQETLVGVFPDNIEVENLPGVMPKLSIFVKVNCSAGFNLRSLTNRFIDPEGNIIFENSAEQQIIDQAAKDAEQEQSPSFGVKSTIISAPFQFNISGRYLLVSVINDEECLSGFLNIKVKASNPS